MTLATLLRARLDRPSRSINARVLQIVFSLFAPLIVGFAIPAFYVHQNERDHIMKSAIATARALTSAVNLELASMTMAAQVLASSQFIASDDFEAFHREATRLRRS